MIRVEGLAKSFGSKTVFESVSFDVRRGERVAVLGTNGSGKTTLFRAILGLTDFDGSVRVADVPVGERGARSRRFVGYVPQRPPISPVPLVEFVGLFATLRETPLSRVEKLLETFGLSLDEDGHKCLDELSGGMLQKALLALALAAEVPVLLLDEPTANLDPAAREDFLSALARIDSDATVLLASHRISEVEAIAERILVLDGGGVAFDGPIDALRDAAGSSGRLWVELPGDRHDAARAILRDVPGAREVHTNGRGIWIDASPKRRGEIVSALGRAGLHPGDLRVADEPLTALLARVAGVRSGASETDSEGASADD